MQYVRCDKCGAKALFAASQCPHCSHPLMLRDHHGDFLPMARCVQCDTYYLKSAGHCAWCTGTPPRPVGRWIGIGVAVVALAAAVPLWQWWSDRGASADLTGVAAPAESSVNLSPDSLTTADTTIAISAADTMQINDSIAEPEIDVPTLVVSGGTTATDPAVARRIELPDELGQPVAWETATARTWANVRIAPRRDAEVLGIISPNVSVSLGGESGGWRQVRSGELKGWVDPRNFQASGGRR